MYKINKGLKEWHIDESFQNDFVSICNEFEINSEVVKFYSQQDEDKYIIQFILKNKINDGTFLELGACDGILYSNTKTLEDYFGFNGILIEPIKDYFQKLEYNRPNQKLFNLAVSNSDEKTIKFIGNDAEAGIVEFINKKKNESTYEVPNVKLSKILEDSNLEYIDIMIIDVEGAELNVIESIDFNFPIYCIFFEAHSDQQEKNQNVGEFLKKNGFEFFERQRGNEVWYNPKYFRRNLFKI